MLVNRRSPLFALWAAALFLLLGVPGAPASAQPKVRLGKSNLLGGISARHGATFKTQRGWQVRHLKLDRAIGRNSIYVTDDKGQTRHYEQSPKSGEVERKNSHQSFKNGAYREVGKFNPGDVRLRTTTAGSGVDKPVHGIMHLGPVNGAENTRSISFQPKGNDGRFQAARHGTLRLGAPRFGLRSARTIPKPRPAAAARTKEGKPDIQREPLLRSLGLKVITPKKGSSYVRRGRRYNPDAAKVEGVTLVKGHKVKGKGYRRAHLRKLPGSRVKLDFLAGTHVRSAADQLVATANRTGKQAIGLFNGTAIYAKPGDAAGKVVGRWDDRMSKKAARARAARAARPARPQKPKPSAAELLARRGNLLNQRRASTGPKLQAQLEKKAAAAGYRAWDFYGVTNLRGAGEIAAFAKHYASVYPKVAKDNILFAAGSGRVVPGTEALWRKAAEGL